MKSVATYLYLKAMADQADEQLADRKLNAFFLIAAWVVGLICTSLVAIDRYLFPLSRKLTEVWPFPHDASAVRDYTGPPLLFVTAAVVIAIPLFRSAVGAEALFTPKPMAKRLPFYVVSLAAIAVPASSIGALYPRGLPAVVALQLFITVFLASRLSREFTAASPAGATAWRNR